MLCVNSLWRLLSSPGGADGAERAHGDGVAAGFGGDVSPVAQGVQPAPDPCQGIVTEGVGLSCQVGDGGQDRPDVVGDVEVRDGFSGEAAGGDTEVV